MSRRAGCLAAITGLALLATAPSAAAQTNACLGDPTDAGVPRKPGPLLQFGINPAGEAGALGPAVPAVPDDPPRTLAALARLRPPGSPFVLRLNRFFWSLGEPGIQRFLALAQRYTSQGYLVELQVRYHPPPGREGDIPGFLAFVREVVRRFGPNRRVIAAQITNEVNLTFSPDSSDGAYAGARDALVQGVIAAKDEARRRGHDHLKIGFNWFYRMDPNTEASFWGHLRDRGGPAFVRAVDWVGLDVYPGTVFPPAENPGGERNGMVAAMSQLRKCFMPIPGLGEGVPIKVEENGWPTGPGRAEDYQAFAMETMIRAVHDFRGTYNVTDYRWFDLRDHRSSSANFQHHYGILRDDYSPKPAFETYRRLLAELSIRSPAASPRRRGVQLGVRARYLRGNRCGLVRATVVGRSARSVRRVDYLIGGRRVARRTRASQPVLLSHGALPRGRRHRLTSRSTLADGRRVTRSRLLRICPARRR